MQYFVDRVKIFVKSGKGGAGCVSFRRERYIPYGGPDGGNGGQGGSVIFVVKDNLRTLYRLKLQKRFIAKNGQPGMGKQRTGKDGNDVIIEVPPGTVIYDDETDALLKDFDTVGERFVLLKGGKGGKGNMNFATSTNQAPRYAQPGLEGKELFLRVELKLIADIGLVGFPNAGKSTLLSVVSAAKPKIADYPFTTLSPNLGIFKIEHENFVMADIPGIIEGASEGAGLGLEFLKHIERTKVLLYIVNLDSEDYLTQLQGLQTEIKKYSTALSKKPYLIGASKLDIENGHQKMTELQNKLNKEIIGFSSVTTEGIKQLLYKLKEAIIRYEQENTKE